MARCHIGDGKSMYFWTDLWHNNYLYQGFPHLFSYARNPNITIEKAIQVEFLEDLFHLPLSVEAFAEF